MTAIYIQLLGIALLLFSISLHLAGIRKVLEEKKESRE